MNLTQTLPHTDSRPLASRLPYARLFKLTFVFISLATIGWHLWLLTQIVQLRNDAPEQSAFMQHAVAAHPERALRRSAVPYHEISPNLKRAVIAAEDASFATHYGFDWEGMQVALEKNMAEGRFAAGGSTISQQLVRNLFLSADRTLTRKAEEAIVTLMLETVLSKERILELYLNYAEWGRGIYGAEAAARHYFHKPASRLSRWQAARLAAMLPAPRYYDGHTTAWLSKKTRVIKQRMRHVQTPA